MTKAKKIISIFVHCYPPKNYSPGGVEYLVSQIKSILDLDYEVHIFTGQGLTLDSYKTFSNYISEPNEPTIHRLALNQFWQRLANKLLYRFVTKFGIFSPFFFGPILKYTQKGLDIIQKSDLIFGFGMPTKMIYDAYVFAKKFNKPLILHPSYHNVSYYNHSPYFQKAFNYATKVIYQTKLEKMELQKNYFIPDNKFYQLAYCPFTLEQVKNQQKKYPTINPKNITLGFIGQINPRKNLIFFKDLLDNFYHSWIEKGINIKVFLAGAKTNSSHIIENQLSKYINNKIVSIKYNFTDQEKEKMYQKIDVFVNPSTEESLGIVNFESSFYGLPTFVKKGSAFAEFMPKKFIFDDISSFNIRLAKLLQKAPTQQQIPKPLLINNKNIYTKKLKQLIS